MLDGYQGSLDDLFAPDWTKRRPGHAFVFKQSMDELSAFLRLHRAWQNDRIVSHIVCVALNPKLLVAYHSRFKNIEIMKYRCLIELTTKYVSTRIMGTI